MTVEAVAALTAFQDRIIETASSFSEPEWNAPSAAPGWLVRDVISHLAVGARALIDPLPLPEDAVDPPENRERQHDMHVALRRSWTTAEVLEEFMSFAAQRLERIPAFQNEPLASNEIEIPGLGAYPMHAVANALAFDYYCHLYHDICEPGGPIYRDLPEPAHDELYPVVQWMMWGLPQMQGPELDNALFAPLTLDLTGPGAGSWTITRPDPEGGLVVAETGGGDVVVTSAASDFVSWGTRRSCWRNSCTVEGDSAAATAFLATLDIV
ncbi:MAG: maleylpyruvate isomerase N-terminal domain-containing protein [Acidimicrobiaceae bacterium]|nr:maleylpyruvate isomerase N-terminal domain-containing protein [Acidimicrobiaceae bacterium]